MTSKIRTIAKLEIVNWQRVFHIGPLCVDVFTICLCTKFHMSSWNISLVTTVKQKTTYAFYACIILFYVLKITWTKVARLVQDLLPYIISEP
jgi:hypothetical protein